jgi:hypothetical protein
MIELHDWYQQRGQARGPGFLVAGIKNPTGYVMPDGFESSAEKVRRKDAENSRKAAQRELEEKRERRRREVGKQEQERFSAFWASLTKGQQAAFEAEALAATSPTKRDGLLRAQRANTPLSDKYRLIILRDHFQRAQPGAPTAIFGGHSSPTTS